MCLSRVWRNLRALLRCVGSDGEKRPRRERCLPQPDEIQGPGKKLGPARSLHLADQNEGAVFDLVKERRCNFQVAVLVEFERTHDRVGLGVLKRGVDFFS